MKTILSHRSISLLMVLFVGACGGSGEQETEQMKSRGITDQQLSLTSELSFGDDVTFMRQQADTIVLGDDVGGARIAIVPDWQGRVMTSSASGDQGVSYGWLNYKLIERGVVPEAEREGLERHIYIFGGEDRFWIGPEGGQFSWYFAPDSTFDFDNWKVPGFINTQAWQVTGQDSNRVLLQHRQQLQNWSGTPFDLDIEREIVLLNQTDLEQALGLALATDVKAVAYESRNCIANAGNNAWTRETGQPSIWILGMFKPGANVVIPYLQTENGEKLSGPIVKDDYFGKVSARRLKVDEAAGVLYFSGDGTYRSKIGVSPERSLALAGSWDADRGVLTVVQYNEPPADSRYVNSSWELQDEPFKGDAINSYNDGPVDGGILGPFYELETSSPALALAPGEQYQHIHRTVHLEGPRASLDAIARHLFKAGLDEIERAVYRGDQ